VQLPFQAEQDVALGTPVIRNVPRGVLDHADADITEVAGAPEGQTGFAMVKRGLDG
jgi:hypothetical protein